MSDMEEAPRADDSQGPLGNSQIASTELGDLQGERNPLAIEPVLVERDGRFIGAGTVTGALHLLAEPLTLRQIRDRLETLACIAYGTEVSARIANDERADRAEREQARESAEVMWREIARGIAELHAGVSRG